MKINFYSLFKKFSGCNQVTCSNCGLYFCWLCGVTLSRSNPYRHFADNEFCDGRLFEGVDMEEHERYWRQFEEEDEEFFEDFPEEGQFDDVDENGEKWWD